MVAEAVGEGGRGPFAAEALPADGRGALRATGEGPRVELGEPECTGGCRGYLTVLVQRHGGLVEWSGRRMPRGEPRPPAFHFDAVQYDAEPTRALTAPLNRA
ncbi:hypothetical protein [Streptomyces sp. NPDC051014]|uniref:hypothetical protein n=1 Tax=Streptomyces sp. NPDC051014 TaxID=3155751 RepID=UPI0033FEBC52